MSSAGAMASAGRRATSFVSARAAWRASPEVLLARHEARFWPQLARACALGLFVYPAAFALRLHSRLLFALVVPVVFVVASLTIPRSWCRPARPWLRLAGLIRHLEKRATSPDEAGPVVRLEGTVSASERADGVVLGAGNEVWPARFTVSFEGGEAHVEPSALCVSAKDEVRLGDRVELLGPAVRTTCGGGSYRAGRLALLFEGVPERPIFVRKR